MNKIFVAMLLGMGLGATALAQPAFQAATADSLFRSLHERGKFNGNVLFAEKGKIIYQKSFGPADRATGAALNSNSVFELASCSKQFTAMAIALLQHQGKLSLDDDFTRYIPELQHYKHISIGQLVYHTSGLPDYMADTLWGDWDDNKIAANQDVIERMARFKPEVLFAPGEKFEYSNTGYMLLASIVERLSGKRFGDYLQQYIFKPLHMKHSLVYNRRYAPRKVDNYAYGYVMNDSLKQLVIPDNYRPTRFIYSFDGIVGDGCVNATAPDLLKWDQALYTNQLLPAAEMQELFTSGKTNDGKPVAYGFGWFIDDRADRAKLVYHTGGWGGYVTYIERDLQSHRTIILLQNSENRIPRKEMRLLMDHKPLPAPVSFKEIALSATALAAFEGQYQLLPDLVLTLTREGDQLWVQAAGQTKMRFYPAAADTFFCKDINAYMEFVTEAGRVTRLNWHQNDRVLPAPRIQ